MSCFDDKSLYFLNFPHLSPKGKICIFVSRVLYHLKKKNMHTKIQYQIPHRHFRSDWILHNDLVIWSSLARELWLQSEIRELNCWAGCCSIFTFTTRWQHCSWELYLFHLPLYNLLCGRLLPRTVGGTTHTLTVKGFITGTLVSDGDVKS